MGLEDWHELFIASAGAAAALAGLMIVAMSVNIREIIAIASMPARAGTSIASLVLIVVVSIAGLIPGQPVWMLGLEALVFALVALAFAVDSTVRIAQEARGARVAVAVAGGGGAEVEGAGGAADEVEGAGGAVNPTPPPRSNRSILANGATSIVQVVPFVVGGLLLLVGAEASTALSWIAAGILLVFIGAVINAWVLLVEILR